MAVQYCWNCEEAIPEGDRKSVVESADVELCDDCDAYIQPEEIAAAHVAAVIPDDLSLPIVNGARSIFEGGGLSLMVIEEDDIDQEFKDACETFADDFALASAPDALKQYFDYEAFAEDMRADGYASMFSYQHEREVTVYGCMYHVFYH